jgi:hypothetical protein
MEDRAMATFTAYNAPCLARDRARRSKFVSRFDTYRECFPNARLTRSERACWNWRFTPMAARRCSTGQTHEQFGDFFHIIGSDPENRIVILTGSLSRFATAGANSKED